MSRARFILLACASLLLASCDTAEQRKAAYFARGEQLFLAGDDARAQLELRNTLQIDGTHAQAWYLLGRIAERQQDYRVALGNYARAVDLAPSLLDARVRKAQLLVAGGQLQAATPEVEAALALDPGHPGALVARGTLRQRQGDAAGAEHDFRAALSREPGDAGAAAMLAAALAARSATAEAAGVLQDALAHNPDETALQTLLLRVQDIAGDSAAAIGLSRALIAREPAEPGHRLRLADRLVRADRPDEAEAILREALAAMPDAEDLQLALLRLVAQTRGTAAARSEVGRLLESAPESIGLRFVEAELQQAAGDSAAAEQSYRAIIERAGVDRPGQQARNALARLLALSGRADEALPLVDAVLEGAAGDVDALALRAAIRLQQGDADAAIADLRLALREQPERVSAHRLLGRAHLQRGEYGLARAALESALELAPGEAVGYLQLADLNTRMGDAAGAAMVLERLLERQPDNLEAQQALTRVALAANDGAALEAAAARIVSVRPEHPLGHYLAGLALQREGRHVDAVERFEQALQRQPGAFEPLFALAQSELDLQRPQAAERRVLEALAVDPENVFARNLLGDILLATGQPARAREQFLEAIRLHPRSPRAYVRLSRIEAGAGGKEAALRVLEDGVRETGGSGYLMLQRAALLDESGQREAAIQAYETLLQRFPDTPVAVNNLAVLLAATADAPGTLERALGLARSLEQSDVPEFLDTLGWIHHLRGEHAKAQPYLERAVAGRPGLAQLRYHLARNMVALGRNGEAREHLRRAAEAGDDDLRKRAGRALDALGDGA